MNQERIARILSILKGLGVAIGVSLIGMAILAAAVVYLPISDGLLLGLNQALKIVSICLGVLVAVGPGGSKGFLSGLILGLLYMALGYGLYALFANEYSPAGLMVGEMVLGALIGALSGALVANLKPKKRAVKPLKERFKRKKVC